MAEELGLHAREVGVGRERQHLGPRLVGLRIGAGWTRGLARRCRRDTPADWTGRPTSPTRRGRRTAGRAPVSAERDRRRQPAGTVTAAIAAANARCTHVGLSGLSLNFQDLGPHVDEIDARRDRRDRHAGDAEHQSQQRHRRRGSPARPAWSACRRRCRRRAAASPRARTSTRRHDQRSARRGRNPQALKLHIGRLSGLRPLVDLSHAAVDLASNYFWVTFLAAAFLAGAFLAGRLLGRGLLGRAAF